MNPDAIEAALLSGKPLQTPSSAPNRQYTEDDCDTGNDSCDDDDDDDECTDSRPRRPTTLPQATGPDPQAQPYANAQGRQTGVKGVLDDRRASALASQREQDEARAATGAEQAARAMVGMTIHEEDACRRNLENAERESREDGEARARWRRARRHELEQEKERERTQEGMKRGGVREVGREGFLGAVERRGWVVVLIYEPDIPRCQTLLTSLLALSLTHPMARATVTGPAAPLALFRARAASLRFSLLPPGSGSGSGASTMIEQEDEDADGEEGDELEPVGRPDPDVLPTMLVYKDGELARNWVRVDWEMGAEGVEALLKREGIISKTSVMKREEEELDGDEDE